MYIRVSLELNLIIKYVVIITYVKACRLYLDVICKISVRRNSMTATVFSHL